MPPTPSPVPPSSRPPRSASTSSSRLNRSIVIGVIDAQHAAVAALGPPGDSLSAAQRVDGGARHTTPPPTDSTRRVERRVAERHHRRPPADRAAHGGRREVAHGVASDPGRLTRSWADDQIEALGEDIYTEIVGVTSIACVIDRFHLTPIGEPIPALPTPLHGRPDRLRPDQRRRRRCVGVPVDGPDHRQCQPHAELGATDELDVAIAGRLALLAWRRVPRHDVVASALAPCRRTGRWRATTLNEFFYRTASAAAAACEQRSALSLEVDLERVLDQNHVGQVGVPHSAELLTFTEQRSRSEHRISMRRVHNWVGRSAPTACSKRRPRSRCSTVSSGSPTAPGLRSTKGCSPCPLPIGPSSGSTASRALPTAFRQRDRPVHGELDRQIFGDTTRARN